MGSFLFKLCKEQFLEAVRLSKGQQVSEKVGAPCLTSKDTVRY